MKIQPLRDNILVREVETKATDGKELIIPNVADVVFEIIACGKDVDYMIFKAGDKIIIDGQANRTITSGKEFIINEKDVVGIYV